MPTEGLAVTVLPKPWELEGELGTCGPCAVFSDRLSRHPTTSPYLQPPHLLTSSPIFVSLNVPHSKGFPRPAFQLTPPAHQPSLLRPQRCADPTAMCLFLLEEQGAMEGLAIFDEQMRQDGVWGGRGLGVPSCALTAVG